MTTRDLDLLQRIAKLEEATPEDVASALPALARAIVRDELDRQALGDVTRAQAAAGS